MSHCLYLFMSIYLSLSIHSCLSTLLPINENLVKMSFIKSTLYKAAALIRKDSKNTLIAILRGAKQEKG